MSEEFNNIKQLCDKVEQYYSANKRDFPWRQTTDPYRILVSEVMLQQTQTYRVEPKYLTFLDAFPTFETLAVASFTEVLALWKGLGYNRRALALHNCAKQVVEQYNGKLPKDPEILKQLPGIGAYTSHAVPTFAFNKPYIFIETNIRAVFIKHCFAQRADIKDKELLPLIQQALKATKLSPRDWYYALMDYGVYIKQQGNPNKKSAHYTVQSKFEGSTRQVRGKILEILLEQKIVAIDELPTMINRQEQQINTALTQLLNEKLVCFTNRSIQLVN
ncbi:hypothetical protein A3F06_02140 [candidate division TM6 bacterium RIFCSPHIGHO2_12_FULL_36_22]|nr:MAG: hypothetical protein A3F06_02140 [candidate division TM6 bacterium RIFCSPHIGHO2_12_FULL_36_22]